MSPKKPPADAPPPPPDLITVAAKEAIDEALPGAVLESELGGMHPFLRVGAEHIHEVCVLLKEHEDLRYDGCHLISGVDRPSEERIEVVYHLVSYEKKPDPSYRTRADKNDPWVAIKVYVPRDKPEVPTVADVWTGADWHERETWDLVGVVFTGRTELRRILLPEDWPGHPLR